MAQKKWMINGLMSIIIMFSMIVIVNCSENALGLITLVVGDGNPPTEFTTIQAAVNYALNDVQDNEYQIHVNPDYNNGMESGPITIDARFAFPTKKIALMGMGQNPIILSTQQSSSSIIDIQFPWLDRSLSITNFEFHCYHPYCTAIKATSSNNIHITRCTTTSIENSFEIGFHMDGGSGIDIWQCNVCSCIVDGIKINDWDNEGFNGGITYNTISINFNGLNMYKCKGFDIYHNEIVNNDNCGIIMTGVKDTSIYNDPDHFLYDEKYNIKDNDIGLLIDDTYIVSSVDRTSNLQVEKIWFKVNNDYGIYVKECDLEIGNNIEFIDLLVEESDYGIKIEKSNDISIIGYDTCITDNQVHGLFIEYSKYINIDCDTPNLWVLDTQSISYNGYTGIYCKDSDNFYIKNTTFENNGDEDEGCNIKLYRCSDFQIGGNSAEESYIGIKVQCYFWNTFGIRVIDSDSESRSWIKDIELHMEFQNTENEIFCIAIEESSNIYIDNIYQYDNSYIDNGIHIFLSSDIILDNVALIGHSGEPILYETAVLITDSQNGGYINNIIFTEHVEFYRFDYGIRIQYVDTASAVRISGLIDSCNFGIYLDHCKTNNNNTYSVYFHDNENSGFSTEIYDSNKCSVYLSQSGLIMTDYHLDQDWAFYGYYIIYNLDSNGNQNDHLRTIAADENDNLIDSTLSYWIYTYGSGAYTYDFACDSINNHIEGIEGNNGHYYYV